MVLNLKCFHFRRKWKIKMEDNDNDNDNYNYILIVIKNIIILISHIKTRFLIYILKFIYNEYFR